MSNTTEIHLQNPASDLPEELIIFNILPKLPVKSLLRFKIVSKKWNSSISSPYFAKLHFNQSSKNRIQHILINHKTCFLSFDYENFEQDLENGDDNVEKTQNIWDCSSPFNKEGDAISTNKNCLARVLKCDFHFSNSNLFAIGSCNGLVCLLNTNSPNSLYLWNPTILALREIPYPEYNPNPNPNPDGVRKPINCPDFIWGFGYDSSTNDYKIVRLFQNKSNNVIEIQIFSTINNNWRSLQEISDENLRFLGIKIRFGAYADNAIYWTFGKKVQIRRRYQYKERNIGFDLVAEKLIKIPPFMYATIEEIGMGIERWINVNGFGKNLTDIYYSEYINLGMTKKGRFILYVDDHYWYNTSHIMFVKYSNEHDLVIDLKLKIPPSSKNVISYVESLVSPFG